MIDCISSKSAGKTLQLYLKNYIADVFGKFSAVVRRATFKRTSGERSTCIKCFSNVFVGTRNSRVFVEQTHCVSRGTTFHLQRK